MLFDHAPVFDSDFISISQRDSVPYGFADAFDWKVAHPPSSPDPGQHRIPLSLVLLPELVPVVSLLFLGPQHHLPGGDDDKKQNTRTELAHKANPNPGDHFEHVVGTGDKTEAKTTGYPSFPSTRTAQAT